MSDANIYQPHVFIDGLQLRETRDGTGAAALANLSIKWGTDNWFDNFDAARLEISILDRRADYGSQLAARNAPIRITRDPDDTVVFVGQILEADTVEAYLTHPDTGKRIRTFEHRLTADDPLGALQRHRSRGRTWRDREGVDQVAHWGPCTMAERKEDLQNRTPVRINFAASPLDQYDYFIDEPFVFIWPVSPYERQQVVSALTVLRNTVRIGAPLARPYYNPATNTIEPVSAPERKHGLTLNMQFPAAFLDAPGQVVINGNYLERVDELGVQSTALEQISRFELQMRDCYPNQLVDVTTDGSRKVLQWVDGTVTFTMAPNADAQLTIAVESDHARDLWDHQIATYVYLGQRFDGLYGQPKHPSIRYRFDKHATAPSFALPWLSPMIPLDGSGQPVVYRLAESELNQLLGAAGFSVTGGELSYTHRSGWQHTLTPSAVPNFPPNFDARTLGDLDGPQQLSMVVGQLLADWRHITKLEQ